MGTSIAPVAGWFDPKIRAGTRLRRDAGERLLEWARWNRDPARPLVWFHASSVGEGLQAQAVLLALRRIRPDCQIVYTHFSPSAVDLARRIESDVSDCLPYDLPQPVDRLLGVLEPDLVVFAKLDVWPELSTRAATGGAQVAIVAATVSPGSSRLRWPARQLLQPGYSAVVAAAAISLEDGQRLVRLGVDRNRIQVLGDPRFDSVVDRVGRVSPDEPLLRFGRGAPTLVAGSTWPADENVLLPAFTRLRQQRPDARLIVVPHEPTGEHLNGLEQRARAAGLPSPVRLSAAEGPVPFLVADRVGVLAVLYGAGTIAYVGGGYGAAGLHSVLEPAAWALPVTFGPRWQNSRDAALLLEAGAAVALPDSGAESTPEALRELWAAWLADEASRKSQGLRGREVVDQGTGASERSAAMLARLISGRRPRRSPPAAQSTRPSMR